MPCRQTYQVNNRWQNKAAQRDQSYRNCLAALLIFFCMCLILILACIPWKVRNYMENNDKNIEREAQPHHEEHIKETTTLKTTLTPNIVSSTQTSVPMAATNTTTGSTSIITMEFDIITGSSKWRNVKPHIFERYYENRTESKRTTAIIPERSAKDRIITTEEIIQRNKTEENNNATTKRNYTDLIVSRHHIVTDENPSTSSYEPPIASTATLEYIKSAKEEATTNKYSSDKYYSSEKPKFGADNITTSLSTRLKNATESTSKYKRLKIDNVTSSTLSTLSTDLVENVDRNSTDEKYDKYERVDVNAVTDDTSSTVSADLDENTAANSTSEYERSTVNVVTDNIILPTTLNLSIDLNETSSTEYSSGKDYYSEQSQSDVTSNILTSTRLDSEKVDENAENSTDEYLNHEGSTTIGYNAKLINDEYATVENSSVTENFVLPLDEKSSATAEIINEAEDMMNVTASASNETEVTEKYSEDVTFVTTEKYNGFSTDNDVTASASVFNASTTDATTIDTISDETILVTTARTLPDEDTNVCETGHCKQIASKMLSYMNYSADPCEDFYEYACGGYEADPQRIDGNLICRTRNYQRIARQMLKEKRENMHSTFATYYDSCVQYERTTNFSERARMANDALRKTGQFYTPATWSDNYVDFTDLFARLMLHHSALLFDVVPELDEYRPNSFTLKIGPSTYESPFKTEYEADLCSEDEFETEQYVNLKVLYDNYKMCKNDTREFMSSIKEALIELNVFKGLNNSYLERERNVESEYIDKTVHVINSVIMQGYFSQFPSESEIREAYLMNNYSKISLEELQSGSAFVNWTRLIYSLTGVNVVTSESLQIYFHNALVEGLRRLEEFGRENPMSLNNAIMGLYAHKLYRELVLSRRSNVKDYCLQVAIYLLRLEASSLYISSFSDQEITQMNRITKNMFNELKETLKLKIKEAQWARDGGRQELLTKINNLELVLPIISYFKNRDSLYNEYNVSQIILYDNYFNNSMILLRRYRALMYAELRREVGDLKQIWTYYVTPFQSKAQAIYGLNLVVIPYGIIDWSLINDESFDYLLLATFGNLIAHQIAHHFDANGIHYWNKTRNIQDSLLYQNEFTDTNFDDYITCQKENLYREPMNMTLPFTNQIVLFTIPRLTLNERLSEIMGLRLAYDTLDRMRRTRSHAEIQLPWTKLRIDQLFYLAYAQMYCTKSPLTSSYVSLYESEDLPSRIRVFVSASNTKLLAEAWNCPVGSKIAPNDICSVFPYIEFKEAAMMSV